MKILRMIRFVVLKNTVGSCDRVRKGNDVLEIPCTKLGESSSCKENSKGGIGDGSGGGFSDEGSKAGDPEYLAVAPGASELEVGAARTLCLYTVICALATHAKRSQPSFTNMME